MDEPPTKRSRTGQDSPVSTVSAITDEADEERAQRDLDRLFQEWPQDMPAPGSCRFDQKSAGSTARSPQQDSPQYEEAISPDSPPGPVLADLQAQEPARVQPARASTSPPWPMVQQSWRTLLHHLLRKTRVEEIFLWFEEWMMNTLFKTQVRGRWSRTARWAQTTASQAQLNRA